MKFSELVGDSGRVIAVEPTPETFALLALNALQGRHSNITLLNVAASSASSLIGWDVPLDEAGMKNLYMARLDPDGQQGRVVAVQIDSLRLPHRVSLVKIDVEGHEISVLKGMAHMLRDDRPVLIVEDSSPDTRAYLEGEGYESECFPNSPNVVYYPGADGLRGT